MSTYVIILPGQETGRNIHLIERSTTESLLELNCTLTSEYYQNASITNFTL